LTRDISERRRAEDRLDADLQAMTRLHRLGTRSVQADAQFDEVLGEIVEAAIAVSGANKGNMQLFDATSGKLRLAAHRGFADPFFKFFAAIRDEASACATAKQCGERVVVEDVSQSPIFASTPSLDVLLEADVRAVQSTPLVSSTGVAFCLEHTVRVNLWNIISSPRKVLVHLSHTLILARLVNAGFFAYVFREQFRLRRMGKALQKKISQTKDDSLNNA
jgi:hypothetical protein